MLLSELLPTPRKCGAFSFLRAEHNSVPCNGTRECSEAIPRKCGAFPSHRSKTDSDCRAVVRSLISDSLTPPFPTVFAEDLAHRSDIAEPTYAPMLAYAKSRVNDISTVLSDDRQISDSRCAKCHFSWFLDLLTVRYVPETGRKTSSAVRFESKSSELVAANVRRCHSERKRGICF